MKQHDFTFRGNLQIEGVEATLIDELCGKFDSNTNGYTLKSNVTNDAYRNFTIELENGIELDCEAYLDTDSKEWIAHVWELD